MATCPNKNLSSWKTLASAQGEDMALYLWDKYEGNVPSEYNESLNDKLVNGFLKDFNITATEYNDLKEELGLDALSASDLITKSIAYKKDAPLSAEAAYFAFSMLGRQNNKLRSDLRYLINKWNKYQERFDYHKGVIKDKEGFDENKDRWRNKIRDLVILDFLKENIEKQYTENQPFNKILDTKWTREDFSVWESVVKFLKDLLTSFAKRNAAKAEKLQDLGRSIADEILNNNYEYFDYKLEDDQIRKYYNRTVDSDPFAKELVEFGQKELGIVLTGSLALRRAGEVYRTVDETLHDIDWVVPFELNNTEENQKTLSTIEGYQGADKAASSKMALSFVEDFDWFKKFKEKYPSFKLINGFYGGEHQDYESLTVQGVIDGEFYEEDGVHSEEKSYYKKDPVTKQPVKVKKTIQVNHKKGDWIKDSGYAIDFFVRLQPNQEQHENYFKLWKEIMIAKLQMGRDKDFSDWKAFVPYLKSKDGFNFNYEGFRHINYEISENNAFEETEPATDIYLQATDEIERVVSKFKLKPVTRYGQPGFTTKNDRISKALIDKMQDWFNNHRDIYPTINPSWNKTYNLIVFKDSQGNILSQLGGVPMSTATPELLEKLKVAADKMGIDITSLQKYLETTGVNVGDVNGLADLMRGVVAIAEGKEGQALTEELVHVATAIVEQVNPKLMTELISKINRFKIYDKTLRAYETNKNYQTPDGKPDIRKIKKEAVDKLIAELIVNNGANEEQFPELRQAEERSLVQRMWDAVLDFIRGIYRKADIDIFRQVATNVAAGNVGGKASLIQSTKTYYQITDAQQTILNKLVQTKKELDKVDREDVNDKGEKIIKQIYVRTTAEGTKDVKTRVTDVVRERGKQSGFDEENLSLEERTFNAFKRDEGIEKHGVMENIHKRYFNEDGTKRENPLEEPAFDSEVDEDIYEKLNTYFKDLVISLPEETIFLAEQMIYNPTTDMAGTIDLLAIEPTGKVNIYDWKFGTVAKDAKDIAWYKQEAYNIQLGLYKSTLKDVYGAKEFRNLKAIPIQFRVNVINKRNGTTDYRLNGINIGSVDPSQLKSLLLTPISEETESTGDDRLDKILKNLNTLVKRIADKSVTEDKQDLKIEKLDIIRRAARMIQGQNNLSGLIDTISVLQREGEKLVNDYEVIYKNRPATSEDSIDKDLSAFAISMATYLNTADMFDRMDIKIGDYIYTKEMEEEAETDEELETVKELKETLDDLREATASIYTSKEKIKTIFKEFGSKHIGERNAVVGLTEAEPFFKGLAVNFKGFADIGMKALNVLGQLNTKARAKAQRAAYEKVQKLMDIRKKIVARGDAESIVNKIFKKTKTGDKVNKLIDKYDPEFRKKLRDAAVKDDVDWLFENIDVDRVRKEGKEILDKKIKRLEEFYKEDDDKLDYAIDKVTRIWDIDNPDFNGWKSNYLLYKYPKDKWFSEEYKEVAKDPELFELYNYIIDINEVATDSGFIEKKVMNSFLPFIRKSVAEKLQENNFLAPIQDFYDGLKMNPDDVGIGKFDEITGKLINGLPRYYTYDFSKTEEGVNDYSDVSFDIFRNLILYTQEVEKYKYLEEVEGQVEAINIIEEFKENHIATNRSGGVIFDENNNPVEASGNQENIKLLDDFTRAVFYEQKYVLSDTDTPLGLGKAINGVKKMLNVLSNKTIGKDIVDINEDVKATSLMKLMDAANRGFSIKVLALDPAPALVNFLGSQFQISAQAGTYFTQTDVIKGMRDLTNHTFRNKEDREAFAQLVNLFQPLREGPIYEELKKSSLTRMGNVLNGDNISDFLMMGFRKPELFIEKTIFKALLDNTMVENGKLVNINDYVKAKYKGRYDSADNFQEASGKIEEEVNELKKTRSISATKKIVNGKLEIPGFDTNNIAEVERLTKLNKDITNRVVGSMSKENINRMSMNIWTRGLMVFKNWIYPLYGTRFNGIEKLGTDSFSFKIEDDGTIEGEKYDIGRVNLFAKMVYETIKDRQNNIKNLLKVNEEGVKKINELYDRYQETYYKKTGQRMNMSKEDFADMIRTNLRNELKEINYIVGLFAAAFALGIIAPGDDADKATKNRFRYYEKLLDKIRDELTFFYNPNEIRSLLSGGIFPAIGVVTDVLNLVNHIAEQITGMSISKEGKTPEQIREEAMPIKDVLRIVPGGKNVLTFGAIISEDWAKEFDITIQKKNTIR